MGDRVLSSVIHRRPDNTSNDPFMRAAATHPKNSFRLRCAFLSQLVAKQ
jgi:hypothetical protein